MICTEDLTKMLFLHWPPHHFLIASPHFYLSFLNTSFYYSQISTQPHFQPLHEDLTVLTLDESTSLLQNKGSSKKKYGSAAASVSHCNFLKSQDETRYNIQLLNNVIFLFFYREKISQYLGIFTYRPHIKRNWPPETYVSTQQESWLSIYDPMNPNKMIWFI